MTEESESRAPREPPSAWERKRVASSWAPLPASPSSPSSSSMYSSSGVSVAPISLKDVMSEQLAVELRAQEEKKLVLSMNMVAVGSHESQGTQNEQHQEVPQELDEDLLLAIEASLEDAGEVEGAGKRRETGNDEVLAHLLQLEFDREHDACLSREAKKLNGVSKLSVSFDKYRRLPEGTFSEDEEEEDELYADERKRDWDSFEKAEKSNAGITIGKQGFARQGNTITTKHDPTVCGRRNACRVMEFSSNISTGDGGSFDMKLSNSVYNVLKKHSISEGKRSARLHEKKERSTVESVMDETTRLMLYKLVNRGILDEVNGTISSGKEANVYHGIGGNPEKQVTVGEVAIKVYKTTLNEFKNRDPYIKDDFRFKDRFSKQNPRKVIHLWAEKEMFNLTRIRKVGIPCPEVVVLKKHILVMTFIGSEGKSAPTLKDARLSQSQLLQAYNETVEIMKKLYSKCDLVHADLSEFNLLWHLNRIWVIDVSQSVLKDHPLALEFLLRDCYNVSNFFTKRGVPDVLTSAKLFTLITGKQLLDEKTDKIELLSKIDDFERDHEYLAHGINSKGDNFDEMFERSCQERQEKQHMKESRSSHGAGSASKMSRNNRGLAESPPEEGVEAAVASGKKTAAKNECLGPL